MLQKVFPPEKEMLQTTHKEQFQDEHFSQTLHHAWEK